MLDQNFEKPALHLVLDQIASSEVCFIQLNIDCEEKSMGFEDTEAKETDPRLQPIFDAIDAAVDNKMKKLKEIVSAYECTRFMSMNIPVVFLTPIPSDLWPHVDKYLRSKPGSKTGMCHERVIVNFKRIQPEFRLEIEPRPSTLGRHSLFYPSKKSMEILPTIPECQEPESTSTESQECMDK